MCWSFHAKYGITAVQFGVESHNTIGVGERYHSFLHCTYEPIQLNSPNMDLILDLPVAVKVSNDAASAHEFPSSFSFWRHLWFAKRHKRASLSNKAYEGNKSNQQGDARAIAYGIKMALRKKTAWKLQTQR